MNKYLKWIGTIVLIFTVTIIVSLKLFDLNKYKPYLNEYISKYGFQLEIEGNIKFSLFPNIGIYIDSPTKLYLISNHNKEAIKIEEIKFDIQLLPLFSKKLYLENLYLKNVYLNADKKLIETVKTINKQKQKSNNVDKKVLEEVKYDDFKFIPNIIEIQNSSIYYNDEHSKIELSKINLKSKSGDETEFTANFRNLKNNIQAEIKAEMKNLGDFIAGNKTGINLLIGLDDVEFILVGNAENNNEDIIISELKLKFDSNELDGKLAYNKMLNTTNIQGSLKLKSLIFPNDLTGFFEEKHSHDSVKKYDYDINKETWSSSKIDLSFLSNLSLNLNIIGKEVQIYGVNIEKFKGNINVKNNNLNFVINEGKIAQGSLKAKLDVLSKNNHYRSNIQFKDASIEELCKDLFNYENASGVVDLDVNVEGIGNNMASLIRNLHGNGALKVRKGRIIDTKFIPRQILDISKIDFNKIEGSFNIKNGIIYNQDFILSSPFVLLTGQGAINLPSYTINYLINPEKVYDNKIANKGFAVEITGSLRDPHVSVNVNKFIEKTIKDTTKKVFKNNDPLNKVLNNLIDGIL